MHSDPNRNDGGVHAVHSDADLHSWHPAGHGSQVKFVGFGYFPSPQLVRHNPLS